MTLSRIHSMPFLQHSDAVQASFLNSRPHPFKRCDITLLVKNADSTYTRGSYNQDELAYPASTVKLTFLVSAIEWCKKQNLPYDCLDDHVRPMIYTSDNFETGVVVDYITQTVNYHPTNESAEDPKFKVRKNSSYLDLSNRSFHSPPSRFS